MRNVLIGAAALAAFCVQGSLNESAMAASKRQTADATLSFSECFDLGWVRGMHLENNELPAWIEECQSNNGYIEHAPSPKERARARHGKTQQTE